MKIFRGNHARRFRSESAQGLPDSIHKLGVFSFVVSFGRQIHAHNKAIRVRLYKLLPSGRKIKILIHDAGAVHAPFFGQPGQTAMQAGKFREQFPNPFGFGKTAHMRPDYG